MDLIRIILLKLEEKENPLEDIPPEAIEGYDSDLVSYHFKMLSEANLIEAIDAESFGNYRWIATNLTWFGHDFLDAAKNDTIWNKAKEIIKKHGGIFSIEVLKPLLIKLATEQLKVAGYL